MGGNNGISLDKEKLLLLFLIFIGLSLRVYHIDLPPMGYHNMKETEYLSQAREFYFNGDYLHRRIAWLGMQSPTGPGYFEEYAQLPILPWLILLAWKTLGMHVWLGRLIIIVFSLGCIPLTYYVSYELTGKKDLSTYAAFFMAIIPLAVFFGRNIQPETPALFFIMLSTYYYLKWTREFTLKYILASLISFSVAGLFKYTFMIAAIPLLFVFPFEKLKSEDHRRKLVGQIPLIILCLLPLFLWAFSSKSANVSSAQLFTYGRIHPFEVFSSGYWEKYFEQIKNYSIYNFTTFYVGLTFIGLLLCSREIKTPFSRFCVGSALMAVPYSMLLSDYIRQHSYYQMPFLPLVLLSSAYVLHQISMRNIGKSGNLKYLIIAAIILISLPSVKQKIDQQYDIIFFGLDAAGDSINELSDKEDRVFIAGHAQTVGMLWNADRYGAFLPTALERFKFGEDERHMKWIFVYDDLGIFKLKENPKLEEYVVKRYSIREVGILKIGEKTKQMYLILEKVGSTDTSELELKPPQLAKKYETSLGELELYILRAE